MASTYTLTSSLFPNGTTVYANAIGEDDEPVSAVVSDGAATFDGLRELQDYKAHATIGTPDIDGSGVQKVSVSFTTGGGSAEGVSGIVVTTAADPDPDPDAYATGTLWIQRAL